MLVDGGMDRWKDRQHYAIMNIFFFFKMCVLNPTIRVLTVNNACIFNSKFRIQ